MATNPLKSRMAAPPPSRSKQEAVDYGNAFLASIGRNDLHWYIHKDQVLIGFKWKTA